MRFLAFVFVVVLLVVGCGQETNVEQAEEEAGVEEVVEEETTSPVQAP